MPEDRPKQFPSNSKLQMLRMATKDEFNRKDYDPDQAPPDLEMARRHRVDLSYSREPRK